VADPLDGVLAQVATNRADLGKAIQANANAGSDSAQQNAAAVSALLGQSVVSKAAPTQTPKVVNNGGAGVANTATATASSAATATTTAAAAKGNGGKGNKGGGAASANNGNGNSGKNNN
jgi:hypothetical protein